VVKVTTDNKTRSAQDVRSIFAKHGGNLAASGAVAFQFLHAGQFLIAKDQVTEDRLMEIALDAGADDVITTDEGFEVRCEVTRFDKVLHALDAAGIKTASSELAYIPTSTVPVNAAGATAIERLHDGLEEHDDVQHVFSNEEAS
jgi:transcriptional/translational regulatory protein YebC/TACO1